MYVEEGFEDGNLEKAGYSRKNVDKNYYLGTSGEESWKIPMPKRPAALQACALLWLFKFSSVRPICPRKIRRGRSLQVNDIKGSL
ncbi:unnamed protein product [Leptosia nina]|uniref:Uncharacterized protein n=1 Tax=Leptosia nina TaxID=320188 RepID=A0AAV1K4W5_9NEOP